MAADTCLDHSKWPIEGHRAVHPIHQMNSLLLSEIAFRYPAERESVPMAKPATLSLTGEESAANQITKVPTRRHLLNKWIATRRKSVKTACWPKWVKRARPRTWNIEPIVLCLLYCYYILLIYLQGHTWG